MNIKRWGVLVAWVAAIFFTIAGSLMAAEGERPNVKFDHDQTTFQLSGMHTNTACESCHVRGVFKGTPTTCTDCHSRGGAVIAQMKPASHIPATQNCSVCHSTQGWFPTSFNHSMMTSTQTCATCHNGLNQTGKPANHIQTTKDCGDCHKTTAWTPAGMDHSSLVPPATSRCSDCHGKTATGKPSSHIYTTSQCDICHNTTVAWLPASFDHGGIDPPAGGRCNDCHLSGPATKKTATHIQIPLTEQCDACHTYSGWLPTNFAHTSTQIGTKVCSDCHNGTSAKGLINVPLHIPVVGQQCDTCHTPVAWLPTSFDHSKVVAANNCKTCHDGTKAVSSKKDGHLVTGQQCDVCHVTVAWKPSVFAHNSQQLGGQTCNQCHNGTIASGRPLTGASAHTAAPMTGNCDSCHTPTAWTPATMNHSGAVSCTTCHIISATATLWTYPGKANHIATTGHVQCSDCHTTLVWKPSTFSHQGITSASNCTVSCHNSSNPTPPIAGRPVSSPYAHIAAPMTSTSCGTCHTIGGAWSGTLMNHTGATTCTNCHVTAGNDFTVPGKANHLSTTGYPQCSSCHATSAWLPTKFAHTGVTAATNCTTCHNGTNATGRPIAGIGAHLTAPMTSNTCASCHTIGTAWLPEKMNHTGAVSCTNCHVISAVATTWTTAKPNHITTVGHAQCSDCHTTAVWTPSTFAHQGITSSADCTTCHGGPTTISLTTQLSLKSHAAAPMTGTLCGSCHTIGSTWVIPPPWNHAGATSCVSCHVYTGNGSTPAKVGHLTINTATTPCSTCHSTSAWVPAKAYDHVGNGVTSATTCSQSGCHDMPGNAVPKAGMPTSGTLAHKPPMTDGKCGTCHAIGTVWSGTLMNHTGATTCTNCHVTAGNGFTVPGKSNHIPTTGYAQCSSCHATTSWLPTSFSHTNVTSATVCTTCHNGTNASGSPTGALAHTVAPMTATTCGSCHTIGGSWTVAPPWNHTSATNCAGCHVTAGNGFTVPGKSNHISTTGYAQCISCHTTASWLPTSFSHSNVTSATNCTTCHNGVNASGSPVGTKAHTVAPMTNTTCGACHTIGGLWTPTVMNHAIGGTVNCISCHTYAGNGFTPVKLNHINTQDQCSRCHATGGAGGNAGWLPATGIDHSTFTGTTTCTSSGCHDGITATGRPTSSIYAHLQSPMSTANCGSCHTTNIGTAWMPTSMNHTGADTCTNCHDVAGTKNGFTVPGKLNHIPTTGTGAQCSSCHTVTAWKPTSFNHTGISSVTDCYTGCHNGVNTLSASIPPANLTHTVTPMTSKMCGTCHTIGVAWTIALPWSHTGASNCVSCHAYTGNGITPAYSGHVSTGTQCIQCHAIAAWNPATSFDHVASGVTAATTCNSAGCHSTNGAAVPKAGMPISGALAHTVAPMTNGTCGTCHAIGTVWSGTLMNHTGVVTCTGCHATPSSGGFTLPVKSNHVTTTAYPQCSACHKTTAWQPSTFSHQGVTSTTDCKTGCHNGTNTLPLSTQQSLKPHTQAPMTGVQCGACHTAGGAAWAPGIMNHTGITTCNQCHAYTGNSFTAAKVGHITTTSECILCHATVGWLPTVFTHTTPQIGTNTCKDCHNGTAAVGPTVATHTGISLNAGGTYNCNSCHTIPAWNPALFGHTGVTTGCATCHKTGFATAPSTGHFITSLPCETCHKTTAWSPIKTYSHMSTYYKTHSKPSMTLYSDCLLCHINNNQVITGAPHKGNAGYKPNCAWCHATQYKASSHTKTSSPSKVYYTVAELTNCSGACHEYATNAFTTIKTSRTGHHSSTSSGF